MGDLLVMSCDGASDPFVVALDRSSGKTRWKTPRPKINGRNFAFSTPNLIEHEGKKELISAGAGQVCRRDRNQDR